MAQFDVYPNPVAAARDAYPLLIELQADVLPRGSNSVFAPLAPRHLLAGSTGRISPMVQVGDAAFLVLIRQLTHLPTRDCSRRVAHLPQHRDALLGAIDLLFYGV